MSKYFNISIIGSGNVAWHLSRALENAGHTIHEVFSRKHSNAKKLTRKLYSATAQGHMDFSKSKAEIFIMAVPDNAIEKIASKIKLPPDAIIVHTSGSIPINMLKGSFSNTGVFYPLQTFSKLSEINFGEVPILIEAKDKKTENRLSQLAKSLSKAVHRVNSEDRKGLHIAAVFACNFTNHMMAISGWLLNKQKLDFNLLKPLIIETINKSLDIGPDNAQTGPALRGDLQTLDHHMDYLKFDKSLQEIYRVISQHIIDHSGS